MYIKEIRILLPVLFFAISLTLLFAGWLLDSTSLAILIFILSTPFLFILWVKVLGWCLSSFKLHPWISLVGLFALVVGLVLYLFGTVYLFRPELMPQKVVYDFTANLSVTERLVDPALLKVETWDIQGEERQVLFVHPSSSGSTSLVYPVKIEPRTVLRGYLAIAPEAWYQEGDGVVFSVYVEDESGMHLLFSRYVDAKHHQLDRSWLPLNIDLSGYSGNLVRIILTTSNGPAGDGRYDWSGWGEPRLERPLWP